MASSYLEISDWFVQSPVAVRVDNLFTQEHSNSGEAMDELFHEMESLAETAHTQFSLTGEKWVQMATRAFQDGKLTFFLFSLCGINSNIDEIEDLLGERAGGWARTLSDPFSLKLLSMVIGNWVLRDTSRMGYLEAWIKQGETSWKKIMALRSTIPLISDESKPNRTLIRILQTAAFSDDPSLKAAFHQMRQVLPPGIVDHL